MYEFIIFAGGVVVGILLKDRLLSFYHHIK